MTTVGQREPGDAPGIAVANNSPLAGSVRAALAYRDFRILWTGQTVSSIGSWMQNIAVGPYALALSKTPAHPHGSASFVAVVSIAQMAPMLLLALVGGLLTNRLPRRGLILAGQAVQLVTAIVLAALAIHHPTKAGLVACVLVSGIAVALSAPTYQSVMPELVDREDMPGAISLNSASLNGSRVVGPLILLALAAFGVRTNTAHGIAFVFVVNGLTFLASMAAVAMISIKPIQRSSDRSDSPRILDGFREARRNPVVGRTLTLLFFLSLFCLPYISQFPSIAERNLGVDANATSYKIMYGVWALGAMVGSLAQATLLARVDKRRSTRWMLAGFAVALLMFAAVRSIGVAMPVVLILGFFYFGSTTAMSTVMQQHVTPQQRGPVMALWLMAFGGTIPFGSAWGGRVIDHWSPTPMLVLGGIIAALLATAARFESKD